MARSAQSLNHSTVSIAPRGKSASAVGSSSPAARAPARRAAIDQPSNGTLASVARSKASFPAISSIGSSLFVFRRPGIRQPGKIDRIALPFLDEHQQPVIGHALWVENAVEMVAFVLHDAGMKALDLALDRAAVEGQTAIAYARGTGHGTAQPGNREASFPAELERPVERLDVGGEEDGALERQ